MKKYFSLLATLLVCCAVVTSCSKTPEPEPEPDPVIPTLTIDNLEEGATSASFTVTVNSADKVTYTYYKVDERPADDQISWTEATITGDGELIISFNELPYNFESRTVYTFEVFASRTDTDKKGIKTTYKTEENLTKNFQTPKVQYVSLSDVVVAAGTISGNVAVLADYADAYCLAVFAKGEYDETIFKDDCMFGTYASNGATFLQSTDLAPMSDYIIAYVAIKGQEVDNYGWKYWEVTEFVGEVYTSEVTTSAYSFGQSEASLTIETVEAGYNKLMTDIKRTSGCGGFFGGAVETSTLTDGIEKYVEKWFMQTNSWGGYNYSSSNSFYDMNEEKYTDSQRLVATNLEMGKKYTLWVVAYDEQGRIGKLTSVEQSTKSAEFTGSASVEVTVSTAANGKSATVTLTPSANCATVYYVNESMEYKADPFTQAEIETQLLGELSSGYGNCWTEQGEYPLNYLSKNTTYYLHLLPVDTEGNLGKIVTVEYTTTVQEIQFNGDAKVTSSVGEIYYNGTRPAYDVTVTVVDADGYIEQSVSVSTLEGGQGLTSLEGQARYALDAAESYGKDVQTETATYSVTLYGESYYHFAIPFKTVNGARVYGTPVRVMLEYIKQ